jgi:hypothetical protein
VAGLDLGGVGEVSHRARDLEHPVIRTGRKIQACDGGFEKCIPGRSRDSTSSGLSAPCARWQRAPAAPQTARAVARGRTVDSLTYRFARLTGTIARQFFVRHGGNFDVNVNPVQQRPRDPGAIPFHGKGWARTAPLEIPVVSAGTPLRCLFAMST